MSAEIMLVCNDNDECYKGKNFDKCFEIGSTENLSDIALLIQGKIGIVTEDMIVNFIYLYKQLPTEDFSIKKLEKWLTERKGKFVNYEAW